MRCKYRRFAFSFIAFIAIVSSLFKVNIADSLQPFSSHKVSLPTKNVSFTKQHNSYTFLLLETDSEELDVEESDDEVENLGLAFEFFTSFNFTTLQIAEIAPREEWNETSAKGKYPPIYLSNNNFRI